MAPGSATFHGPISARTLDNYFQVKGEAARLAFVTGYGVGYQDPASGDTIQLYLLGFAYPLAASSFTQGLSLDQSIKIHAGPAIPGSRVFDSTTAGGTGAYHHGAIADKGSTVMVVDYVGASRARPTLVDELAQQQYDRLT